MFGLVWNLTLNPLFCCLKREISMLQVLKWQILWNQFRSTCSIWYAVELSVYRSIPTAVFTWFVGFSDDYYVTLIVTLLLLSLTLTSRLIEFYTIYIHGYSFDTFQVLLWIFMLLTPNFNMHFINNTCTMIHVPG